MTRGAREHVEHTVATERGRLRRGSAVAVLALLSASVLAPVTVAVAGGSAVATALAGVAGNMGSGHLAGVIERMAARLRSRKTEVPRSEAVRDALADDLLSALEKGDSTAKALREDLTHVLVETEALETAIGAAGDDLRAHLSTCFQQLADQHAATLEGLGSMEAEQRRQGTQLRRQTVASEEAVDRLRWLTQHLADLAAAAGSGLPPSAVPAAVLPVAVPAASALPGVTTWQGGVEVVVGDHVYLLHDELLTEAFSSDHSLLSRSGRALRLVPAGDASTRHVWLRQAEMRRDSPTVRAAVQALHGERDLLSRLGRVTGLPRLAQFAAYGRTTTLAVGWPLSRSGVPCERLDAALGLDGTPIDPWRLSRLCTGLAGLCATLASLHGHGVAHRHLTPAGMIALDNGRLVLRDLGLTARTPEPGEGPADYQAPEQRRRGQGRPGPPTDVYQLAAVAYHIVTGHPAKAGTPLPVRAYAPDVPAPVAQALEDALATEPASRPDLRALGATLRTSHHDLS